MAIRKTSHPALPWQPENLNDSRCNSSSTEAEVQVAITGHDPTPPERRYILSLEEGLMLPPLLYPHPGTSLLIRRLHINVLVVPPGGRYHNG
ncbi:hypothetical protein AVEN_29232-1 [Araneus ventricosus]|uniref:Uncharacterized protein n=1 Tax=Araneus ventricosus TaxID=182803 RepID=A0A4Y2DY46_ARAVE|nr:hypothetical protein AVEN_29232-1 [Araneus ventricosus]